MVQRTIAPTDTEWDLQAVVDAVREEDDAVILETDGSPKAAVISFERYQRLDELERQSRREEAQRWLRDFEATYDGRNDDLTDEQIEELAVRAGREINHAAAERQRERARRNAQ